MQPSFTEQKTQLNLSLMVFGAPGGGYDTYTRMIARHITKCIPGNPSTVPENMTGAGGKGSSGNSSQGVYRNTEPQPIKSLTRFLRNLFDIIVPGLIADFYFFLQQLAPGALRDQQISLLAKF